MTKKNWAQDRKQILLFTGCSLSDQLNILPILSQKRFENFVLIDDKISFPDSYPPVP